MRVLLILLFLSQFPLSLMPVVADDLTNNDMQAAVPVTARGIAREGGDEPWEAELLQAHTHARA